VTDLPSQLNATSIPVAWSGDDENGAGSGIAGYDVYVSTDGGPYERWLANTATTSGQYPGLPGHEYAFYSVATDLVGHAEAAPAQPDAVTTLAANPWDNYANPFDVDGINGVQPLDVLILINYINAPTNDPALPAPPAVPPPYYDVSDDGSVTALDVLMVINYINGHPAAAAEGEAPFVVDRWARAQPGFSGPTLSERVLATRQSVPACGEGCFLGGHGTRLSCKKTAVSISRAATDAVVVWLNDGSIDSVCEAHTDAVSNAGRRLRRFSLP